MFRFTLVCVLALCPLLSAAEKPRRVITLGSPITETVFKLSAGHRVVGVDDDSRHPPAVSVLPKLGPLTGLNATALLDLKPDLIIASHYAASAPALNKARAAGIRVEVIQIGPSVEQALSAMERVGEVLDSKAGGKWLARDNRRALQRVQARYQSETQKPRVLFMLVDEDGRPQLGGKDTVAATMIDLAGASNIATGFNSYRNASSALTQGMAPDVIVTASDIYLEEEQLQQLLDQVGLAQSPAGLNGRIVDLNKNLLLDMGPRLGSAATVLAEAIRETPDNYE